MPKAERNTIPGLFARLAHRARGIADSATAPDRHTDTIAPDRRTDTIAPDRRGGLVIHLGDFKTGTTAIQTWLNRHGAGAGIATPPGFNQAALAQSLTDPDPAVAERAFAALAGHLPADPAQHAVISAEHFEMTDPARLADLLARHLPGHHDGLRLIAYVRPHPAAYLARFAESTKIGSHDGDLDSYLDLPHLRRRMTYAPRFMAWRDVFGDRFTLRLYDRAVLTGGDVTRDFLTYVTGQDPGPLDISANPTPGLAELALMRALHDAIGPLADDTRGARYTLGRHLGRQLETRAIGPHNPLYLHKALAGRLIDVFGADATAMDAAFFDAIPSDPDTGSDLKAPLSRALVAAHAAADPLPPSLLPEDYFGPETRGIIALWAGMLRDGLTAPDGAALLDRLYHE